MTLEIQTADIAERFWSGETVSALAASYGCHRGTILYRLNQAGARTRTRSKVNARVMLATYKPVFLGLLAQLEKALESVRAEFAANADNGIRRKKYLERIQRLEDQIQALQAITSRK